MMNNWILQFGKISLTLAT